jgi:glutathione S-transferase
MKLRYSPTSPFVRKVWVAVLEAGLDDRIERVEVSPLNRDDVKNSPNPLGKIPCLIADDGMVLFDSPVIVEYLDGQHDGARLVPEAGPARWRALSRQALGDGMLDNVVAIFIESMRKPERQSRGWIAHNKASVDRAIDALEDEAGELAGAADIGRIAIAVALAFFDQHFADEDWRASHPGLAAWFDEFNQRPSMTATVLVDIKDDK